MINSTLSKVALIGLSLMLVTSVYAEPKKGKKNYRFGKSGTMTLMGTTGFSSLDTTLVAEGKDAEGDPLSTSNFNLMPRFGYFVMNNPMLSVEVAAMVGFGSQSSSVGDQDGGSSSTMMLGLDPTLYFNALKKRGLYPFVHFSFAFQSQDTTPPGDDAETASASGTDLRGGAGIALAVGKKKGGVLKVNFDYIMSSSMLDEDENGMSRSGMDVNLSFGIFF
jgi:hypothetical protein